MNDTKQEYDVALSYASEDRAYVEQVASCLKENGIKVFYDKFETTQLWGKNLYEHSSELYGKRAKYAVVFISKSYGEKLWTSHELRSAQAKAFQEKREYILPVRFDDTEIPGIAPTIAYINAQTTTPIDLSKRIIEKLRDHAPTAGINSTETIDAVNPPKPTRVPAWVARPFYIVSVIFAIILLLGFFVMKKLWADPRQSLNTNETVGIPGSSDGNLIGGCWAASEMFQRKLRETMDQVSLLAPSEEDKNLVNDLTRAQERVNGSCAGNERWIELSKLTKALSQMVIKGEIEKASGQLRAEILSNDTDRFVVSRVLLLEAVAKTSEGVCREPEQTLVLLNKAIYKDRFLAAAYNLRGICLAEEAWSLLDLLTKKPESLRQDPDLWAKATVKIKAALRDNQYAYRLKTSTLGIWPEIRFRNNKVWNSMQFILGSMQLNREKLSEAVQVIGEEKFDTMEGFFRDALKDIIDCQAMYDEQPTYFETEAELHALELTYYTTEEYKDLNKAGKAKEDMTAKFEAALKRDLLRIRKKGDWGSAKDYFMADVFLKPYFAEPQDPGFDPKVDPELRHSLKDKVEQRLQLYK